MALALLVSSQKQKLTIAKNFKKSGTEKAVFQRGDNRTFIVSLVDTRFLKSSLSYRLLKLSHKNIDLF